MNKEMKFEPALKKLEKLVESLENDDLELEKSLKVFEEGIKLSRICTTHLNDAEKKIEVLLRDKDGVKKLVEISDEDELNDLE